MLSMDSFTARDAHNPDDFNRQSHQGGQVVGDAIDVDIRIDLLDGHSGGYTGTESVSLYSRN